MKLIKFTSYFIPICNGKVTSKPKLQIGKDHPNQREEDYNAYNFI